MPVKADREYRDVKNIRANEELEELNNMQVKGYACTFNDPYVLWSEPGYTFREQIAPNAFDGADMTDVIMQYDHEGRVFARTSNNTLEATPNEHGLAIVAELGGTEIGRQLYAEIRGGYTDKMSFGFTVSDENRLVTEDAYGNVDVLRTITGIAKLYDVSAVSIPANNSTEISARNFANGEISKIKAERQALAELVEKRKQIEERAKALTGVKND